MKLRKTLDEFDALAKVKAKRPVKKKAKPINFGDLAEDVDTIKFLIESLGWIPAKWNDLVVRLSKKVNP